MGEIIIKDAVQRKPDCLYYIDREGNICETKMSKGKKRIVRERK